MTNDTKMIIASNLTNAAFLREQLLKGGQPAMQTKDVVMQIFAEFVGLLEQKYPEK